MIFDKVNAIKLELGRGIKMLKEINHNYVLTIHPSGGNTSDFARIYKRIIEYLHWKKKKEPIESIDGTLKYILRNGLSVVISQIKDGVPLEIKVKGSPEVFNKSIAAISRIYSGRLDVNYIEDLVEGKTYKVKGKITNLGFGSLSTEVEYIAIGIFSGYDKGSILLTNCVLEIPHSQPIKYLRRSLPREGIENTQKMD